MLGDKKGKKMPIFCNNNGKLKKLSVKSVSTEKELQSLIELNLDEVLGMYFLETEYITTEVDDRGVDFVVRYENGPFLSIQVKSIRKKGYVFMQKEKFKLSPDLYLALAILHEGVEPKLYLIPSEAWKKPNELIVEYDYEGKKSKQEWGVNLSKNRRLCFSQDFGKAKKQKDITMRRIGRSFHCALIYASELGLYFNIFSDRGKR